MMRGLWKPEEDQQQRRVRRARRRHLPRHQQGGPNQLVDRDGNYYITTAELAGSMAKMGHPLSYKELSEMINHAYTNGDSVLSFHQFATSQIHR
ncbi:Probable calcium-binding protein CML15 [Linum grandiflorum]